MGLRFNLASHDIITGIAGWRIWLLLAWQDIRLRYRRSILGPFWITISMAISVYSLGFLYGHLFKIDLHQYFPFLAIGLLVWTLINAIVTDSTNALIEAGGYLRQIKMPTIIFILRVVARNFIIFAHNLVAIIPIVIFCGMSLGWHTFAVFYGLVIIIINAVVYGLILGMLGAKYRDIAQVITSLMQVIFFVTPVMWMPKILAGQYGYVITLNPFAQFIELIRAPIMGGWPSQYCIVMTLVLFLVGFVIATIMFVRIRHRIIYWL